MSANRSAYRWLQTDLAGLYLPASLCFLVINITNGNILDRLLHRGLLHGTGARLAANYDLKAHFLLVPFKAAIFALAAGVLLVPVSVRYAEALRSLAKRDVTRTLGSSVLALLLTATLLPMSSGLFYAVRSTDPFNQNVDQLYRRMLLPSLAYLVHLNGALYIVVFWLLVLGAWLLTVAYLKSAAVELSRMQQVSLLSIGIFAAAYQVPGYPDVAVFLLGMVALIDHERSGRFSRTQAACFALAMMAHEAGAIIVFVPLCLFVLGWRSWLSSSILAVAYVLTLLANFSFHPSVLFHAQTLVGEKSAMEYFRQAPGAVVWATLLAFKFFWILVPVGIYYQYKSRPVYAWFIVTGLGLAIASTYIAVDYSRLVSFATIPLLLCLVQASRHLSQRNFGIVSAVNLIIPSFYLGANTGLVPFHGLYYLVYRHIWHLPAPGIH